MDLILGSFAKAGLSSLNAADLTCYDALLSENDHDLYQWVTGQAAPPENFANLIKKIAARTGGHQAAR